MHKFNERPDTQLPQLTLDMLSEIKNSSYATLVGKNNCGKSYLLKRLATMWNGDALYIGPSRYENFHLFSHYDPNTSANKKTENWGSMQGQLANAQQNIDYSIVNLQQSMLALSDIQREIFFKIIGQLLNVEVKMLNSIEGNSLSQKYISCNGHNFSYTSSGFRLITTIIISLLNPIYDTFLIDEPELGISPEIQGMLADFLFDQTNRKQYFPHIKSVIFATHSTIFLDRRNIQNNYMVEKDGNNISVTKVKTQADFNSIHFFLLGNRFESLYLPSAIILVEGKCDYKFINRVVTLRYPNSQISVISANGDNRIKEILNITKLIFNDLQKSPYRDRIYSVIDLVHSKSLPSQLETLGIPSDNIIVWPKNGIEYYYPESIIDDIFGAGKELEIDGDLIKRNGISYNKNELADKVIASFSSETKLNRHFEDVFISKLDKKLGHSAS